MSTKADLSATASAAPATPVPAADPVRNPVHNTAKDTVQPVIASDPGSEMDKVKVFMYWAQGWDEAHPFAKIYLESLKLVPFVEVVPLDAEKISALLEKELGPQKMTQFRDLTYQMKSDVIRL